MRFYQDGFVAKGRGYWHAIVGYKTDDGRKGRVKRSTRVRCNDSDNRGRPAAEEFLRRMRRELIEKEAEEVVVIADLTLSELCWQMLALKEDSLKRQTYDGYVSTFKKLDASPIRDVKMRDLTVEAIDGWLRGLLRDEGLSPVTVRKHRAAVNSMLNEAKFRRLIPANPMDYIRPPKVRDQPHNILPRDVRGRVLDKAASMGDTAFAFAIQLALMTGMRRGELCALRWSDIDLVAGIVHVGYNMAKDETAFSPQSPKDTKGEAAIRDIPIGRNLAARFSQVRDAQMALRARAGGRWSDSLYVLGDPVRASYMNPDVLTHRWAMLASDEGWVGTQGRPPRFHDLRHTFASYCLIDNLMDVMTLSKILGHRDVSITLKKYGDALFESKRRGMDNLDEMYGGVL